MKKVAFIVVLVAVIAGIVFGGLSIASAAPNKPPPTSGAVYMDTFSGNVTATNSGKQPLEFTYPQARHVSITVYYDGLDNVPATIGATPDNVSVLSYLPIGSFFYQLGRVEWVEQAATFGCNTYEFNADNWLLNVGDTGGDPLTVYYRVTVTYPQ